MRPVAITTPEQMTEPMNPDTAIFFLVNHKKNRVGISLTIVSEINLMSAK
jgi:hypothetical protein